ncbi:MAG: YdcF family protein [gamma proteobacterium endosymbiont of Lamellibrachia anaximandri]|nr:YdcF family protein [gamma proteobacterium endosymbiont of Lamellibrachia anaximandri]MBL3617532.1 YdcF family protein [gamma proteobacterium endosymbiont of Lamellibrachia anaximandri]
MKMMGWDGLTTFFLSSLIVLLSLGLSLIPSLRTVCLTARKTPSTAPDKALLIVLGAHLEQDAVSARFITRLQRALNLYRQAPPRPIMILGGITSRNRFSEAERGHEWLESEGVSSNDIQMEMRSRNTLENLKHARDLIDQSQRVPVFITSRFHLARCAAMANDLGLSHQLCAAEEKLVFRPSLIFLCLMEAFYLHWYQVGKFWSRLTQNRKSLERIS